MSGSTRTTTRSSLAVLLSEIRVPGVAAAVAPLVAAHLALLVTFDLAERPTLTLLLLAGAFVSYWRAAKRLEPSVSTPLILGVAILLRLLLLPLPPTLSDDLLRYAWDGKVVRAGFNPYLLAPEAPELSPIRDTLWERMPHKQVQTVYPPLALALFSIASWLPWPLLGVKSLLCFVEVAGCWLLIRLAQRLGLPAGRAIWYCWSPLATLEVAGMGHVDAMVLTASVGTVLLLAAARRADGGNKAPGGRAKTVALAGVAAAAGVLSKLVPLFALPMWARQSARPAVFLGVALGLIGAALLPVGYAAGGLPPGLVTYGVSWEFNGPLYEPLWRLFDRLDLADAAKGILDELKTRTGQHEFFNRLYPYAYPQFLAKMLLACVFGLFVLYSLRPKQSDAPGAIIIGSGQLLGGLVLCAATVYPWYLLWILPWAALARHPAWLLLSGLMPLAYVPQLFSVSLFPWVYLALWGPFFVLLVSSRWEDDRRWTID